MRILFATDQYLPTPGGISIVTQRVSEALAAKGHTVGVIAPSTSWKFTKAHKNGVTIYGVQSVLVHKLKQLRFAPTFLYQKNIKQIVRDFMPDIVHLETPNSIANDTLIAAKELNIPVAATCHIMPENISGTLPFLPSKIGQIVGDLYMKQIIKLFNKVDYVTAPTLIGTAILAAYHVNKPMQALSNGIDLEQFKRPLKSSLEKFKNKYKLGRAPIILYIGRLDKEKKVNVLIEAMQYLPKDQDFQLVIEGKGQQMDVLIGLAENLGLKDKVKFMGFINEDELKALYGVSSIFVMPSTAELQSLVTMEAMAMGLPVIGAHAGALPYLIKSDVNGYLFEPDDPKDLAGKISKILSDKELSARMSQESLSMIQEHDINNIIAKMEELYSSIIENKNRKKLMN